MIKDPGPPTRSAVMPPWRGNSFRAGLWGVKSLLLFVTLGALFVWPWSYWHTRGFLGERTIVEKEWEDEDSRSRV